MQTILILIGLTLLAAGPALAQNAPPAEPPMAAPAVTAPEQIGDPYTVTDVAADVTADSAAHARDQALTQAEHTALTQICDRFGAPQAKAARLDDNALAALVQSFEVQSERVSAVRYIGAYTIHFRPTALRRALGLDEAADPNAAEGVIQGLTGHATGSSPSALPAINGPAEHLQITVPIGSLADWNQIKRKLDAVPAVADTHVLALARQFVSIELVFRGEVTDLQLQLAQQGMALAQKPFSDGWLLQRTR
jgi:hypothetical protein